MSIINVEEEYQKNPDLSREDINSLKEWLSKQTHLPAIPDEMLIMFLHACDYKLEATKHTIESHYALKTHVPEVWSNRDPLLPEVQRAFQVVEMAALPGRDASGNLVLACRFVNGDPSGFVHVEATKAFSMFHDLALQLAGLVPGVVVVVDQKGATFSLATRLGLSVLRNHLAYLQDGFAGKIINFHIINCVPVTEKLLAIARPLVRSELLDKLKVHCNGMESFYEWVPKDILPKEYGGNAGSFSDMHKKTIEAMTQHRDWFLEEEKLRVDESKKPDRNKSVRNAFGIVGSFKKLDID